MVTKRYIKQLIEEELKKVLEQGGTPTKKGSVEDDVDAALDSTDQLLKSIDDKMGKLVAAMSGLDTSMDFVAAALTGTSAADVELTQKRVGRAAKVSTKHGQRSPADVEMAQKRTGRSSGEQ
tara:strand:- start:109 stop:474 length:366 start_codon:yes stop_codon:yes gene_type:complete